MTIDYTTVEGLQAARAEFYSPKEWKDALILSPPLRPDQKSAEASYLSKLVCRLSNSDCVGSLGIIDAVRADMDNELWKSALTHHDPGSGESAIEGIVHRCEPRVLRDLINSLGQNDFKEMIKPFVSTDSRFANALANKLEMVYPRKSSKQALISAALERGFKDHGLAM
jgi:hypothetical protein